VGKKVIARNLGVLNKDLVLKGARPREAYSNRLGTSDIYSNLIYRAET
jgi:hypothetical protein